VVEVVCGILFQDLQLLLTPHIGLLWQKFKHEYPECEELPPLAPAIEFFDESPDINVVFSEIPPFLRIRLRHLFSIVDFFTIIPSSEE
jgi:hypothetical protein